MKNICKNCKYFKKQKYVFNNPIGGLSANLTFYYAYSLINVFKRFLSSVNLCNRVQGEKKFELLITPWSTCNYFEINRPDPKFKINQYVVWEHDGVKEYYNIFDIEYTDSEGYKYKSYRVTVGEMIKGFHPNSNDGHFITKKKPHKLFVRCYNLFPESYLKEIE